MKYYGVKYSLKESRLYKQEALFELAKHTLKTPEIHLFEKFSDAKRVAESKNNDHPKEFFPIFTFEVTGSKGILTREEDIEYEFRDGTKINKGVIKATPAETEKCQVLRVYYGKGYGAHSILEGAEMSVSRSSSTLPLSSETKSQEAKRSAKAKSQEAKPSESAAEHARYHNLGTGASLWLLGMIGAITTILLTPSMTALWPITVSFAIVACIGFKMVWSNHRHTMQKQSVEKEKNESTVSESNDSAKASITSQRVGGLYEIHQTRQKTNARQKTNVVESEQADVNLTRKAKR